MAAAVPPFTDICHLHCRSRLPPAVGSRSLCHPTPMQSSIRKTGHKARTFCSRLLELLIAKLQGLAVLFLLYQPEHQCSGTCNRITFPPSLSPQPAPKSYKGSEGTTPFHTTLSHSPSARTPAGSETREERGDTPGRYQQSMSSSPGK